MLWNELYPSNGDRFFPLESPCMVKGRFSSKACNSSYRTEIELTNRKGQEKHDPSNSSKSTYIRRGRLQGHRRYPPGRTEAESLTLAAISASGARRHCTA